MAVSRSSEQPAKTFALPRLLDLEGTARELDVSKVTVRRLIDRGAFPALRVGQQIRVDRADLARYIDEQRAQGVGGGAV